MSTASLCLRDPGLNYSRGGCSVMVGSTYFLGWLGKSEQSGSLFLIRGDQILHTICDQLRSGRSAA